MSCPGKSSGNVPAGGAMIYNICTQGQPSAAGYRLSPSILYVQGGNRPTGFSSTRPVREKTIRSPVIIYHAGYIHFDPLSGAWSDNIYVAGVHRPTSSIHAPRAGSDAMLTRVTSDSLPFQSTLPVRGSDPDDYKSLPEIN